MDYMITTEDGKKLVIENGNSSDSKKRIAVYYNALIQHNSKSENSQTKKTIEYVVGNMDEDEAIELEKDIIKNDSGYSDLISSRSAESFSKRMMAYMNKIKELSQNQKKLSEPMQEMVDKYKKYDFESIVKEEINGNEFSYKKDKFPIEQYRQELAEMGNKSKGNKWFVSVSSDGRLVIY